jgi:hypothetical protein
MFVLKRRCLSLALLCASVTLPRWTAAQTTTSTISICTPGALADCAIIKLTQELGVGVGTNFFEVAINNLGSLTQPGLATAINTLTFSTKHAATTTTDASATPTALGGATVFGGVADWDMADDGQNIFLEALFDNNGVGGCAAGGPVDDGFGDLFGQTGQTCGPDEYIAFSYLTPTTFDLSKISITDIEVAGLGATLTADSCGAPGRACLVTPEPASVALTMTGLIGLAGLAARRKRSSSPRFTFASET